jgi:hypothetical protein
MTTSSPIVQGPTPGSAADRAARMDLANVLAAQVDAARHLSPVATPLLNWSEGEAITQLLEALAVIVNGEPLGELASELAAKLRTRLGHPPGHDPARMAEAVMEHLGRRLGHEGG